MLFGCCLSVLGSKKPLPHVSRNNIKKCYFRDLVKAEQKKIYDRFMNIEEEREIV
jgi:hypothetical protein